MQNSNMQIRDIHARIYEFVILGVKFTKKLPQTVQNKVAIYQLVKSLTSMGANDQEANGTESKKDFIAKYSIVKKENKETNYWLRVIEDTNDNLSNEIDILKKEGMEILLIVSKIIINAKNGLKS